MEKGQKKVKPLVLDRTQILKLDIGCGDNKLDDHLGMDYKPFRGVDVVHDARIIPWPFEDETFTLLSASHFLEHITRENGVFIDVMNEAWRILKPGGQFRIAVPYGGNTLYNADPTHVNPIVPQTFHYFDPFAQMQTYHVYKPKPWKIELLYWQPEGTIECLLSKRKEDPSYGKRK